MEVVAEYNVPHYARSLVIMDLLRFFVGNPEIAQVTSKATLYFRGKRIMSVAKDLGLSLLYSHRRV
jgi:hypothetical protein